ncbi:MAG: hypothetical protein Q7S57_03950 [bacterium]|nr:hypothetical protein [bacterium]
MSTILEQLSDIVVTGEETTARTFIIEHINEFPVDMKNELIFAFLQEAVEMDTAIKEIQNRAIGEGVEALKEVRKVKSKILDKKRIFEILGKINK